MNFVVDSSFALAWVLEDEANEETEKLLDSFGSGAKGFVPALWRWEVLNALLSIERSKRATKPAISSALARYRGLPIELDAECAAEAWSSTRELAQKHGLTSYDAAYLELALRLGLPLATHDAELRSAAAAEGVRLIPPTKKSAKKS